MQEYFEKSIDLALNLHSSAKIHLGSQVANHSFKVIIKCNTIFPKNCGIMIFLFLSIKTYFSIHTSREFCQLFILLYLHTRNYNNIIQVQYSIFMM